MTRPSSADASSCGEVVAGGSVPKHAQLRTILLARIGQEWRPHAAIPSERELMATYGVSRATVREAVGRLVVEEVLHRVHGRGTFVAGPRVQSTLHLASFTQDMRRRGLVPATVVRGVELGEPPLDVRGALALGDGDRAWRVERLRLADGEPMALEVGWYVAEVAPDLGSRDLTGSIYSLLAEAYDVRIEHAEQTAWAEGVEQAAARPLHVSPGAPVLVFQRTSAGRGRPIEHVTSRYRGDRYQVHMTLTGR